MAEWIPHLAADDELIIYFRVMQALNDALDLEKQHRHPRRRRAARRKRAFYTATTPHSYDSWGKTTHLGCGLPLMIGAKMAKPEKFCLNLMGDGPFGMSGTDLETAARSGAAITTVLLNNSAMASYSGPTQGTIGAEAREQYGVSTMHGDDAKIAEGMGAIGISLNKPAELEPSLKEAQRLNASGRSVLIDVRANVEERQTRFDTGPQGGPEVLEEALALGPAAIGRGVVVGEAECAADQDDEPGAIDALACPATARGRRARPGSRDYGA